MNWKEAVPQLRRRLQAAGLDDEFSVVARMPVAGYAFLLFLPMALLGGIVSLSSGSVRVTLATAAVVAAAELVAVTWARATVLVAGRDWIAHHGLFTWRVVRLGSLRRADTYVSKSTSYLRLWDDTGGHIALDVHAAVPPIRPMLTAAVAAATDRGADISASADLILGLPDLRTEAQKRSERRRAGTALTLLVIPLALPLLFAGPVGWLLAVVLVLVAYAVVNGGRPAR